MSYRTTECPCGIYRGDCDYHCTEQDLGDALCRYIDASVDGIRSEWLWFGDDTTGNVYAYMDAKFHGSSIGIAPSSIIDEFIAARTEWLKKNRKRVLTLRQKGA